MKIFITGTGGFIGGVLAKRFLEAGGHSVAGQYRTSPPDMHHPSLRLFQCDLTRKITFDDDVDYIVHCAALQDFRAMPAGRFIDDNRAMTENVACFAREKGVKGLIFISSIELHGQIRNGVIDENTDRVNPSLYGISKHLSELVLKEYEGSFPTVALRLCGVVGPGAKNVWLARVLAKAKNGEEIGIVNGESPFNNVVHTDDLFTFMHLLMKNGFSGFHAFPIASKAPVSVRDVVAEVIRSSHSASTIVDNGLSNNSFMISNDFAMTRFHFEPSDVLTNLRRFVRDMHIS